MHFLASEGQGDLDAGASLADLTQTDIGRLTKGRVRGQFWSVYVPSALPEDEAFVLTVRQVLRAYKMISSNAGRLALVRTADECLAAREANLIASLLGAEGGHCIASSLEALRALHRLGVAYMTLTHNDSTAWADSATGVGRAGGLSGH